MKRMNILILVGAALLLAGAVLLTVGLIGRSPTATPLPKEPIETDDTAILVDFCSKTVATVGGDGYDEVVLYQNPDGSTEVHFYSRYEGDEEEAHTAYRVDSAVIGETFDLIAQKKIAEWNETEYFNALDGARYVLKFRTADNGCVYVSSDNMPEDGVSILYEIRKCMTKYVSEENRIG